MRNRIINLGVVAEIAQALGDLNESVVFVGGAVISIYADDPAADEVRPTQDVDLTLKLLDFSQRELDAKLAERGFHPDIQGHAICTYKYNDIAVDIMASTDSMRGPTNRWYSIGFDSVQKIQIEGVLIQILSAACVTWQQSLKHTVTVATAITEPVTILRTSFMSLIIARQLSKKCA
jgi:hypothetical protein